MFPELFQTDRRGHLVFDAGGDYVPREVKRRELRLPDFHALRHGAAMDCDDAEEARDLLRHKNSNVTRAIYRAHFGDRRRELLRAQGRPRPGSPNRRRATYREVLGPTRPLSSIGARDGRRARPAHRA